MKLLLLLHAILCSAFLPGCTTTSFASPKVNKNQELLADGSCPAHINTAKPNIDQKNVFDALRLVENHIVAYECAQRKLANGRQWFEVPSALALTGGATAAALGAGPTVAIATGAGSATLERGNAYFAPRDKAHIVAAAYDAVTCIKQEASGITAMKIEAAGKQSAGLYLSPARSDGNPGVELSPEFQYYQLVTAALDDVRGILAGRLSSAGDYAPKLLAQEIADLSKQIEDAGSRKNVEATEKNVKALAGTRDADPVLVSGLIVLEKLQPQLELCVVDAKVG